jgi:clan AA aspartic protease
MDFAPSPCRIKNLLAGWRDGIVFGVEIQATAEGTVFATDQAYSVTIGLMYVSVTVGVPGAERTGYRAQFLVDTGATDSMVPGSALASAGIQPIGRTSYELADGRVHEYSFGLAQIEFLGEITAGRIIFGPEGTEPILGVTALESVGVTVDPATGTLKRLPAVPLK